ncbi:MAG: primosomal protein N' family DNA-binding protein, partial [Solirubrobacteraceae bacterium]
MGGQAAAARPAPALHLVGSPSDADGGPTAAPASARDRSAGAPPSVVRVQPLASARALDEPFDYRLSGALAEQVRVGSLLVVPFAGRHVLGVALELASGSE